MFRIIIPRRRFTARVGVLHSSWLALVVDLVVVAAVAMGRLRRGLRRMSSSRVVTLMTVAGCPLACVYQLLECVEPPVVDLHLADDPEATLTLRLAALVPEE